jgi:hypothetical protein
MTASPIGSDPQYRWKMPLSLKKFMPCTSTQMSDLRHYPSDFILSHVDRFLPPQSENEEKVMCLVYLEDLDANFQTVPVSSKNMLLRIKV